MLVNDYKLEFIDFFCCVGDIIFDGGSWGCSNYKSKSCLV